MDDAGPDDAQPPAPAAAGTLPRCGCGREWHGLPAPGCPGSPAAGPWTGAADGAGGTPAGPDLWQRLAAHRAASDVWCAPDLDG